MSHRIVATMLLLLLLTGCAELAQQVKQVTSPQPPGPQPTSPGEAVAEAGKLSKAGKWSEALATLDAGILKFPNDNGLRASRDELAAQAQLQKTALLDEILVGDAENEKAKVELLDRLLIADPDSPTFKSSRLHWHEALGEKLDDLIACGERHVDADPALASRCVNAAAEIPSKPEQSKRLAGVESQLKAREQKKERVQRAQAVKRRQARAAELIAEAKAASEKREYRRALDILKEAAKLTPEDPEIAQLQGKTWSLINPQVDALIKLGDHLYLDENLDGAVATWRAALTMKPYDEEILTRIERAKTVQGKLDSLRREQNTDSVVPDVPGAQSAP